MSAVGHRNRPAAWRRAATAVIATVALAVTGCASRPAAAADGPAVPEAFTPLIISALSPDPVPVTATDGKVHLVYELSVLNASPRPATITTVETLSEGADGAVLAKLTGDEVVGRSLAVGDYTLPPVAAKVVGPGRTVLLILDAPFDGAAAVPAGLVHRITATFGAFEPDQADFARNNFPDSTVVVGGTVTVGRGKPEIIGPPLQGDSWVAVNACCELSPHRGAMLPLGGRINGGERYAVDWSKFDLQAKPIVDLAKGVQATFAGDPTRNESYFTFGQPVLAVADATVVTVVDDLPEAPPRTFLPGLAVGDLGGNRVVLRIRDGVYAFYGHLMTGSVTVESGDTVRRGQPIAKAGNSGNTSESHLHFHLIDGPEPLTSTNIPWEIDAFRYEGEVSPDAVRTDDAGERTGQLPLQYTAVAFPGAG